MAKIFALALAFLGCLLISVHGAPTADIEERDWIGDIINLIGLGLVTQVNAFITLDTLVTNLISINVDIKNPLIFEITIDRISSKAGLNGTVYSSFDHTFETPVVISAQKSVNSGKIPNVLLTQGATASLDIIPVGKLDLISTDVYLRAATFDGKLGIPIPLKGLKQDGVPVNYTLALE